MHIYISAHLLIKTTPINTHMKAFACLLISMITLLPLAPKPPVKIFMIGDSTMANKSPDVFPETGWGQVFGEYFTSDVTIDNRAMNGRSTKSFINEKRWDSVLEGLKPGNYVFIEFGHNDEKVEKPGVGTTLDEYRANLIKFVSETREKKGIPILMTPVARRNFVNGVLQDTHGMYPDVVREVATKYNVAFIDMQRKSEMVIRQLGDEQSKALWNWVEPGKYKYYPNGMKDNTHFNPAGARRMAQLAIDGLFDLELPLKNYVKQG